MNLTQRNTFHGSHEINENPNVYIDDLTFEIRARAASCLQNTRELPFEHILNLHQVGDPIETHADLFKHGYIKVL